MHVEKGPSLPKGRLVSLDAFRGLAMLFMASDGFGFPAVAKQPAYQNNRAWQFLAFHTDHVVWGGCSAWDLIQPAFMFMVGVALPYSVARRKTEGDSISQLMPHVLMRSAMLIAIGIFLRSIDQPQTLFGFTDVLIQIGLGYPFLFLLSWTKPRTQAVSAGLILILYWAAFALYPTPAPGFDFKSVGVPADWHHLTGFAQHWDRNTHIAEAFERWLLNLFPRSKPFVYSNFGTTTLNFIPSLATMVFGLLAGQLLRHAMSAWRKFGVLIVAGIAGILLGKLLERIGFCPIVRKVWSPSWALYSTGWVFLMLATFYAVIDIVGFRTWAFPLVVVGMNSMAMYVLAHTSNHFLVSSFKIHFGKYVFADTAETLVRALHWTATFSSAHVCPWHFDAFKARAIPPVAESLMLLLVWWLILFWMYRRRIFLRV